MRVLMTSSVKPSLHSGVGSVEHNLIEGLRAKGVEVREYFPQMRSIVATDFLKGIASVRMHGRGCDLIHSHTDISWNTGRAMRTFHGVAALGEKFYREEKPYALMPEAKQAAYFVAHKALERICTRRNKCISVSNYVKHALVKLYGAKEENVTTIYNGIDARTFSPDAKACGDFRSEHKVPEGAVLLTWVGHAEFNKGLHYLIETMNLLANDRKARDVFLAIRSPLSKPELAARGMGDAAIEKTICVPVQSSLAGFYNASDVHLLSSVYEPFCLTLLEAMACGKPVIASDSGGHTEVIPETAGIITPLRNAGAMKDAVIELAASDSLRRKMGGEARKVIESGFTKEHMVQNTMNYYLRHLQR